MLDLVGLAWLRNNLLEGNRLVPCVAVLLQEDGGVKTGAEVWRCICFLEKKCKGEFGLGYDGSIVLEPATSQTSFRNPT